MNETDEKLEFLTSAFKLGYDFAQLMDELKRYKTALIEIAERLGDYEPYYCVEIARAALENRRPEL